MTTVRFGLVGAGGIGAHHAVRYTQVQGAKLTAVIDVDEERATSLARKHDIEHVFTSLEDALAADVFDAVDICLPTWLHVSATVAAAGAGKHVLCEKPMALSLAEADEMIEAADRAGVYLMVAQCRRYDEYWGAVKRALDDGAIGGPVVWRSVSAGAGPGPDWFFARDKGLGPLLDGAVHNYDFARVLFGEAKWAFASTRNFKDVSAPDTGTAIVRFERGDELMLSWSWGLPQGVRGASDQDIMGPEGVIFFGKPSFVDLPPPPEGQGQIVVVRHGGEAVPYLYDKADMYVNEIQAFVDGIKAGHAPQPDGLEGKKSIAIGLAIIESGDTGRIVEL